MSFFTVSTGPSIVHNRSHPVPRCACSLQLNDKTSSNRLPLWPPTPHPTPLPPSRQARLFLYEIIDYKKVRQSEGEGNWKWRDQDREKVREQGYGKEIKRKGERGRQEREMR